MTICGVCRQQFAGPTNRCRACRGLRSDGAGKVLRPDQLRAVERYRSKGLLDGEIVRRLHISRQDLTAVEDAPVVARPSPYRRTSPLSDAELGRVVVAIDHYATVHSQARRFNIAPDLLAKQLPAKGSPRWRKLRSL